VARRRGGRRRPSRGEAGADEDLDLDDGDLDDEDDGDGAYDDGGYDDGGYDDGAYDDEDEPEAELPPGRLGPAAGVAYAVTAFIGSSLLAVREVGPSDPAPAVAGRLVDARGSVSAGVLLTLFSVLFLLVFVAYLHRCLRALEGEQGWLATLAALGGTLMVATLSVVALLSLGSTVLDDYGPDPVIARTLLVLSWQAVAIVFLPTAAFVGAASLVLRRSRVLPSWVAVSGLVLAAGMLVPPLAFFPFLLSAVWIGMLGVLLLTRSRLGTL